MKIVTVLSGGMDSTTLAYKLAAEGHCQAFLSFDYGQKHGRELGSARLIANGLAFKYPDQMLPDTRAYHQVVDLLPVGGLLKSALTDPNRPVPDGHYAAENMKQTVVPNRNAIMLAIAWGYAITLGADAVALGVHAGDHTIYPDCRPEFRNALEAAFTLGNEGFQNEGLHLMAPFIQLTKAEIATQGHFLGVPYEFTWSCYKGGLNHCGTCGTCVERQEAFQLSGVPDPTKYDSPYRIIPDPDGGL